jgi:hypothetical protein
MLIQVGGVVTMLDGMDGDTQRPRTTLRFSPTASATSSANYVSTST